MASAPTKKPDDTALVRGSGHALAVARAALVKRGLEDIQLLRRPTRDFTFVDLLAGIGGMRLGVEAAGGQCVCACEIDQSSARTYQQNFSPSTEFRLQDIRQANPTDIP